MTEIRDAHEDEDSLTRRLLDLLDRNAAAKGHPFAGESPGLMAWDGGTFLGGAQYQVSYRWCFLKLLAVVPEARGRGLGSRLLKTVEDRARGAGATGIWLDTYAFEGATFYPRRGFEEFARLRGPVPAEDRLFMRKTLGATP